MSDMNQNQDRSRHKSFILINHSIRIYKYETQH